MSPEDYETFSEVLTFAPCEPQRCVNVNITDDLIFEPKETFSLRLTNLTSIVYVFLGSAVGDVLITDDDSKLYIA